MNLIHVCLNVADADESIEFYEQFGFEESWSFEAGGTVNRYLADGEGTEIQLAHTEGTEREDFERGRGGAWDHLAILVDDVEETFETVDNYGVAAEPAHQPAANAKIAFIEDPDGHVIELVESLDE